MKFLINGNTYDATSPRDLGDSARLAAAVKWFGVKTTAPPRFVLAQIQSMWRWYANEKGWWR